MKTLAQAQWNKVTDRQINILADRIEDNKEYIEVLKSRITRLENLTSDLCELFLTS